MNMKQSMMRGLALYGASTMTSISNLKLNEAILELHGDER